MASKQNVKTSGQAAAVAATVAAALLLPLWLSIPGAILAAYVIGAMDGRRGRRIGRVPELMSTARMNITSAVRRPGVDR